LNAKAEHRNDVIGFAQLAADVTSNNEAFSNLIDGMDSLVSQRLREARERLQKRHYRLHLYYVTLGRCSANLRDEVFKMVRRTHERAWIDVVDGRQLLLVFHDYLYDVAPPIPSLDLQMEAGQGVRVNGILQRYDIRTDIDSWVFSMSGQAVGDIYTQTGTRLFARNVRGYLGSNKDINRGMEATIENEPEYFWYYNNGITIICDKAEQIRSEGRDILRVAKPQIINGQQTTRTLHRQGAKSAKASVVVRVIRVPRDRNSETDHFEALVSRIVACTNWQNEILPSDLMSNDRRQIEIERQLRNLNYYYVRKRQTKSEARRASGVGFNFLIKKDEFAQAVAACDLDSVVVREGKENLFEERLYQQVFPTADPHYYLSRYWLMREVSYAAKGYPERAYAKWLVLHFMWSHLAAVVRSRAAADSFRNESEHNGDSATVLNKAIHIVFNAALDFYRKKRGKGAKATDVSTFFKRKGRDREFDRFWNSSVNKRRGAFRRTWRKYEKTFREILEA
jgi:AIPR protein